MANNKFREWAKANNITAAEIGQRVGVSKYTVYAYFRGERLPSRNVEKRMETEFGIDTRRMFGR